MGVLKVPKSKLIEAVELNYGDFLFSDESDYESDSAEENKDPDLAVLAALRDDVKRRRKIREQRLMKKYRKAAGQIGYDGVNLKSNSGAKKRRRVEHAQAILAMADPEDICFDFSDICPKTETVFSKLLSDKKSMAKWQALVEKEADEQQRLIEEMDKCCGPSTADDDDFEHVLGGSPLRLPKNYDRLTEAEKRAHHPVHSARARFERLENRFKSVLSKRRGVPYELLDSVEHHLREFFTTSPNGVWIDVVENAHTRLYYHAVAGFLNLVSSSVFGDSGGKLLEIRNKRPGVFIAPYEYLVPFLHHRQGKSVSFSL